MTKPITPEEVEHDLPKPDGVIEVFNELICKYWDGQKARFSQDEVVGLITERIDKSPGFLFVNHYLDIEHLYQNAGWLVVYDKPGYNESYSATFTFSRPESKD